jgi:hypothetical protein
LAKSTQGQIWSSDDVRCMTALPPKAEVHPRSCYVAFVPEAVIPAPLRRAIHSPARAHSTRAFGF